MLLSLQATVFAAESDTPEVGEVVDLGDGKTMVVLENKPDTYTIATGEDLENGNAIFRIITNGEIISEYYTCLLYTSSFGSVLNPDTNLAARSFKIPNSRPASAKTGTITTQLQKPIFMQITASNPPLRRQSYRIVLSS